MTSEEEKKNACRSDEEDEEDPATGCDEDIEMEDEQPPLAAHNLDKNMKDTEMVTFKNQYNFNLPPSIMTKQDVSPPKIDRSSFGQYSNALRVPMTNFIEKFSQVLNKKPIPMEKDQKAPK